MWLISHNVILTKDNLLKRKWQGDPKCQFCPENETITHMFFECSMAKFVWSLVAMVVGSSCRPCSFDQFWEWVQNTCLLDQNSTWWGWPQSAGPFGQLITIFVLKISWFAEIVCLASSFLVFWAELQNVADWAILEAGAEALKSTALQFHPPTASANDTGVVLLHWPARMIEVAWKSLVYCLAFASLTGGCASSFASSFFLSFALRPYTSTLLLSCWFQIDSL